MIIPNDPLCIIYVHNGRFTVIVFFCKSNVIAATRGSKVHGCYKLYVYRKVCSPFKVLFRAVVEISFPRYLQLKRSEIEKSHFREFRTVDKCICVYSCKLLFVWIGQFTYRCIVTQARCQRFGNNETLNFPEKK